MAVPSQGVSSKSCPQEVSSAQSRPSCPNLHSSGFQPRPGPCAEGALSSNAHGGAVLGAAALGHVENTRVQPGVWGKERALACTSKQELTASGSGKAAGTRDNGSL